MDSIAQIVTACRTGYDFEAPVYKSGPTPAASRFFSYWYQGTASVPAAGTDPAGGSGTPDLGGTVYTSETSGGITLPDTSTSKKYLKTIKAHSTQSGSFFLNDRLVAIGGLALTSTGLIDVNSRPLTRYTDGRNVEVWAEVTTAGSATIATANIRYTADDGTSGHQSPDVSFENAALTLRTMIRFPLLPGHRGVRSIQSLDVTTATTSAVINLVMLRRIGPGLPLIASAGIERDYIRHMSILPRVYDGATLFFSLYAATGAIVPLLANLEFVRQP